jgi:Xaa-Pro aminopeptidase
MLAEALREFGAANGQIALEIDFMPARSYIEFQKILPHLHVIDAERLFDEMRMIKTEEEIDILRQAARIVDETHAAVYRDARSGMTEMEIAFMFIEGVLERGCDEMRKLVVGSGERSVYANCPPTRRVLGPGDVMRVDVFATLNGYLSDIARTSVVGQASVEHREIWRKLCDAETVVVELIRPGITTGEIWRAFYDFFTSANLNPAINFLGHSVGLTLHEEPFIDRYRNYRLEEGMVLAIEPVYHRGNEGFHLEDYVLVTAGGCELLSDGRGELPLIQ